MSEERYLVLDDPKKDGDSFTEVYKTLEEANAAADRAWSYKTASEKNKRRIHVVSVLREDLADWAEDEETGEIDWTSFEQYDRPDGAFDSEEVEI